VTLARKATTSVLGLRYALTSSVRFIKCCSTSVMVNHLASMCGIRLKYSVSTSSKSCVKGLCCSYAAVMEFAALSLYPKCVSMKDL